MKDTQNLFMGCAWITNKQRNIFCLLPHVIKFDVTKSTNTENRPLLTVSSRTAFGKYLIIMQMLLPDERGVTFRWVFLVALPTLLGKDWLEEVRAVVTDGDSN